MAQAAVTGNLYEDRRRSVLLAQLHERARERFDGADLGALETFLTEYHVAVPMDDLDDRAIEDLYGSALAHWALAQGRQPGEARVRVYSPTHDDSGWQSSHTVVEVVADEMPFLVRSVTGELTASAMGIHFANHLTLNVTRDEAGHITGCSTATGPTAGQTELYLHIEIDRITDPERLAAREQRLERVLAETRLAVDDWPSMRERAVAAAELLPEDSPERALLQWLEAEHFTFIGAIDFAAAGSGRSSGAGCRG